MKKLTAEEELEQFTKSVKSDIAQVERREEEEEVNEVDDISQGGKSRVSFANFTQEGDFSHEKFLLADPARVMSNEDT